MEYCGTARYFTPFIRVEKGVPRDRDVRDYTSTLNVGVDVVPQVIFDGMDLFGSSSGWVPGRLTLIWDVLFRYRPAAVAARVYWRSPQGSKASAILWPSSRR